MKFRLSRKRLLADVIEYFRSLKYSAARSRRIAVDSAQSSVSSASGTTADQAAVVDTDFSSMCLYVNPGWCSAYSGEGFDGDAFTPKALLCCQHWSSLGRAHVITAYNLFLGRTVDQANAWLRSDAAANVYRSEVKLALTPCDASLSTAQHVLPESELHCVNAVAVRSLVSEDQVASVPVVGVIDADAAVATFPISSDDVLAALARQQGVKDGGLLTQPTTASTPKAVLNARMQALYLYLIHLSSRSQAVLQSSTAFSTSDSLRRLQAYALALVPPPLVNPAVTAFRSVAPGFRCDSMQSS